MNKFFRALIHFFTKKGPYKSPLTSEHLDVLKRAKDVEFIYVYFTALSGNFHQLIIPGVQLKSALSNGLKFDGSSIPGCSNIFDSDMHLALDSSSFFASSAKEGKSKTARIFANVYQEEKVPYLACPRNELAQTIASAAERDSEFYIGVEMEFFLLEKNREGELVPWDNGHYFGAEMDSEKDAVHLEIMHILLEHGVVIEKFHHEVAPGQLEFSIRYDTPMKIADQVMLSKHLVNQIAEKRDLTATFKPKPLVKVNGSGMHIHLKIMHKATQENIFYDPEGDFFLSEAARHFIAGILNRVVDGAAVLNSSENSYKRLVPGYEAPVYVCWASKNRSALVRIPLVNKEQSHTTRIEVRSSDALCNPYLAFSFLMKAGVAGIIAQESLEPAIEENLFKLTLAEIEKRGIKTLPTSLAQALSNFEKSSYIKELFNETLIREYVKIKSSEVE